MRTIGVRVLGVLRAAHVYVEGNEVPLSYDGVSTRLGHLQVQVTGTLDVGWLFAGFPQNAYGIDLFEIVDPAGAATEIDKIRNHLDAKGIGQGTKSYA